MKDGVRSRITGPTMHGPGLKKKFRSYGDDSRIKGKQTIKKGK